MDFRRLDLNLLLVMHMLFEEGRTTLVAQRLRISQPTVSFSLKKLRDFFQDDLFVRAGPRMQPTALAESLREPLRRVIQTISEELLLRQEFDPKATFRTFTFSMSDIGELVFLPTVLRVLRTEAPHASVRCLSMKPDALEEAMATGQVDLAVGYFPDIGGTSFYQQRLFDHHFTCLARQDHPTIGDTISFEQFMAADHAVVMVEGRSQEIFERRIATLGDKRRVVLRSPHFMGLPLLIGTTDMITIVPRAVGRAYARKVGVKLLDPPLDIPPIELKQFWHRRVHREPAVAWLRQLMSNLFLHNDPSESESDPIFGTGSGAAT